MNNTGGAPQPGRPTLLAHRGIAQRYSTEGLDDQTCTATRMLPPRHAFLENTIPSMRAAFAAGADIVEIDVHPTTDGQFAVFHDWTVDCRTDGHGVTREHSMAQLRRLDLGYGYTADGGRTFPFRGRGVGMMPTLDEVLTAFPDRRFNINVKSNDPEEGRRLAAALGRLPPARRAQLMVYGGDAPIAEVRARLPGVLTVGRRSLITCLLTYEAVGWSGWVPPACRGMAVLTPVNVGPWLWGWPHRYRARMRAAGSEVYILGPWSGGGFSTGVDTPQDIASLPRGWSGGVWTNEIESVATALHPLPAAVR
jgi:glycerophosphoryl diester phosphodiesterase